MRQVIEMYNGEKLTEHKVELSQDLRSKIETVFLSTDAIDPESDVLKAICRPRNFPYDLTGKFVWFYILYHYQFTLQVIFASRKPYSEKPTVTQRDRLQVSPERSFPALCSLSV